MEKDPREASDGCRVNSWSKDPPGGGKRDACKTR